VELGSLDVAVYRKPVAGVVLWAGAPIDTTVIHLYEVAVSVDGHVARVRMRRATARRAASLNLLDRIQVRQVFPLWRRDCARGRNIRITAEQPSREVTRPDEVGKGRVLPIAGHIEYIRVVPIDRYRKMNGSLSAGVESLDFAIRLESPR
jgi:hypothetical protein